MKKRLILGITISLVALYLAFRSVDLGTMVAAIRGAEYLWFIPAMLAMFLSVWLRAIRWGYFLRDTKRIRTHRLFGVTMVGYMANNVLPLRVGELVRAYALGSTEKVPVSTAFSTVVVERILDLLSLALLFGLTLLFYPFPTWVRNVGLATSVGVVGVTVWAVHLSGESEGKLRFFRRVTRFLPDRIQERVLETIRGFLKGLIIFRRTEHYVSVTLLTFAMWLLYAAIVFFSLLAFDFIKSYHMPPVASFVVLVMVSIGIAIPSSPGFVGTYDLLAQQSLMLFGVPLSQAMGCAVLLHLINYVPLTAIGLLYALKLNIDYARVAKDAAQISSQTIPDAKAASTATLGLRE